MEADMRFKHVIPPPCLEDVGQLPEDVIQLPLNWGSKIFFPIQSLFLCVHVSFYCFQHKHFYEAIL